MKAKDWGIPFAKVARAAARLLRDASAYNSNDQCDSGMTSATLTVAQSLRRRFTMYFASFYRIFIEFHWHLTEIWSIFYLLAHTSLRVELQPVTLG